MTCLCGRFLRYQPKDDEDEYDYDRDAIPALKQALDPPPKGSVAYAIANIEKGNHNNFNNRGSPLKQRIDRGFGTTTCGSSGSSGSTSNSSGDQPKKSSSMPKKHNNNNITTSNTNTTSSYTQRVLCSASKLIGRFYPRYYYYNDNNNKKSDDNIKKNSGTTKQSVFKVVPSPDDGRRCRVCQEKFFPTDKIITARKQQYHNSCFKCTLCKSKLKNHPDEDHMLVPAPPPPSSSNKKSLFSSFPSMTTPQQHYLVLQCQRCKLDNDQKYKPRILSATAGEKITIGEDEQGDIEQVFESIGDELEEMVCGMVPRCMTCGGDFLTYKGEIVLVGALKCHQECWQMGRPALGFQPSMTLQPLQAAKYLPDMIILRLFSTGTAAVSSGKVLSTLFFAMTDRDGQLKSLRTEQQQNANVRMFFHLDEDAHGNPNHKNAHSKKRFAQIPPGQDPAHPPIRVDILNDQIAPKPPRMVAPSAIIHSREEDTSFFCAQIAYDKFNLCHTINLNVPCNQSMERMALVGASLTIHIQEIHN